MIVLIINGAPRSGKDTFIDTLGERPGVCMSVYSSIDWIKKIARTMGWEGTKEPKDRNFLAALKDISTGYNDMPFQKIIQNIFYAENYKKEYFCTAIREPEEIQKLKTWCALDEMTCHTILIRNTKAEQEAAITISNTADNNYLKYCYDYQIDNNGTIEEYQEKINKLADKWEIENYAIGL